MSRIVSKDVVVMPYDAVQFEEVERVTNAVHVCIWVVVFVWPLSHATDKDSVVCYIIG